MPARSSIRRRRRRAARIWRGLRNVSASPTRSRTRSLIARLWTAGCRSLPTDTLKLTFADTQSHPLYDVLKRFADDVQKRTSGAVEIQVFSIGQLGSGTNILTGLQTGIIDLCAHTSGFIDAIFPKFQVVDLPFLFPDVASAERLLDGPTGAKLLDMLPTKGIYGLGYGHWGWRVVSTIDRKLVEPE